MNNNFRRYIIFWFSQALSQLGSSMTSFALILWAYTQKGTAMTISLMTFFNYIPYVIASLFAGTFVDRHSKKKIMLVSDSIAAICSVGVLALYTENALQIWSIYLVNFIIGFMEAFQEPAATVALGKVIPKERLTQVSGLNSFSNNLVKVLSPVLAASLFAFSSLRLILVIDLTSFLFAFLDNSSCFPWIFSLWCGMVCHCERSETHWLKNGQTVRATSANGRMAGGRVGTQRATTRKPGKPSTKTCWRKRRRSARKNWRQLWSRPEKWMHIRPTSTQ